MLHQCAKGGEVGGHRVDVGGKVRLAHPGSPVHGEDHVAAVAVGITLIGLCTVAPGREGDVVVEDAEVVRRSERHDDASHR